MNPTREELRQQRRRSGRRRPRPLRRRGVAERLAGRRPRRRVDRLPRPAVPHRERLRPQVHRRRALARQPRPRRSAVGGGGAADRGGRGGVRRRQPGYRLGALRFRSRGRRPAAAAHRRDHRRPPRAATERGHRSAARIERAPPRRRDRTRRRLAARARGRGRSGAASPPAVGGRADPALRRLRLPDPHRRRSARTRAARRGSRRHSGRPRAGSSASPSPPPAPPSRMPDSARRAAAAAAADERLGLALAAGLGSFSHRGGLRPLRRGGDGADGFDEERFAAALAADARAARRRAPQPRQPRGATRRRARRSPARCSPSTPPARQARRRSATPRAGSACGLADAVVAVASDSQLSPLGLASFCLLRVLSTRNDEPARASRPFAAGRDGFVMGEGAGALVLEALETAERRGAPIYAEVAGFGSACDAYRVTDPHPDGLGAALAMQRALADAGVERRRGRLHQRPRHLDAGQRPPRDARHPPRLRRRRDSLRSRPPSR